MAYSLSLNGGAIQIPKITFTGDFSVTLVATQQANGRFFCGGDNTSGSIEIYRNNSGIVALYIGTVGQFSGTTALSANVDSPDTIVVARSGTSVTVRVNGILQGTATFSGNMHISWFGLRQGWGNYPATMRFYSCSMQDLANSANSRNYDASLSNGTGVLLPTTAGTNAGTQFGSFPTDDSEWVFFASSTSYSDTLQGVAYTSSGSTLAASRGYLSQLNGVSFTSAGGQLSSALGFSSTLQGATFTSSGSELTSTRGYGDTLTGGSYIYAGGILVSTVSGAAQSYIDALLGGSYASAGASLASSRGYTSQLQGGNYTSDGGSLSAFYGYSSTLNGGSYAYAGNRLISTWSGEVTVTIEGYTIRFAEDSISAKFHAADVSATFDNDHVSVTWRH